MRKGIIFDVDGTLWDAGVQVAEAWNFVLREKYPQVDKIISSKEIYANMGKTMKEFGDTLFPFLPQDLRGKVLDDCMDYENRYLEDHPGLLYPEVREVLRQLNWQYDLFIVSNCQRGYIEVLMRACGIQEYIRDIECFGNTGLSKGDNIRMVIDRNYLDECFYVGVTAMDGQAAAFAGIPFVFASYGFGRADEAVGTINSFADLLSLAKKLLG